MEVTKELDLQRPPLNGNVNAIVNASRAAKPVSQANDEEIKQALRYCFGLIGIRGENLPDEGEKMILLNYIRQNFPRFTVEDIRTAFTMYVQKMIDYTEPPYQNFSVLFLENVMQSYRRLQVTIPRPEIKQALPEQTKPTKFEQDIIARNACLKRFQEYKDHFDVWDFGGACFKYIYRQGLIQISKEEAEQIKEQAARQLIAEAQKDLLKKRPSEIAAVVEAIQAGNDEQIKIRAMKISLMNYFDQLIENGIELKEVLK